MKYKRVQKQGTSKCVADREWEEYDLSSDPFQLRNLCARGKRSACPHGRAQQELQKELGRIRDCAGVAGRDPRVGGQPHCG